MAYQCISIRTRGNAKKHQETPACFQQCLVLACCLNFNVSSHSAPQVVISEQREEIMKISRRQKFSGKTSFMKMTWNLEHLETLDPICDQSPVASKCYTAGHCTWDCMSCSDFLWPAKLLKLAAQNSLQPEPSKGNLKTSRQLPLPLQPLYIALSCCQYYPEDMSIWNSWEICRCPLFKDALCITALSNEDPHDEEKVRLYFS